VSFRARLAAICVALAVLVALFLLGLLAPQGGRESRTVEAPLLPIASPAEISEMQIHAGPLAGRALTLRRKDGDWEAREAGEAREGDRIWPASSERAEALAGLLAGLRRGRLVSRDPARRGELGLESGALLVLRRGQGQPELRLRVGVRAAGGQEDYLALEDEPEVYLVHGNLSVLLAQDRAYWLNLYVFPDEVRGETIGRVEVRGAVPAGEGELIRADYTLERAGEGWTVDRAPADVPAAQGMVEALAQLQGGDLLAQEEASRSAVPASGGLEAVVTTLDGRTYAFRVVREGQRLLLRVSGSPWVYPVNSRLLARAILPAEELRSAR
jgi:hypothetical protein